MSLTIETQALEGRLILVQVVPSLILAILGSHFHSEIQVILLDWRIRMLLLRRGGFCFVYAHSYVFFLTNTPNEAIDENFLVQLLHVFDATVPNRRLTILVKRTALHWIVKHVFELLVRNRVDLECFILIVIVEGC